MNTGRTLAARLRHQLTDEIGGKGIAFEESMHGIAIRLKIKDSDRLAMEVESVEVVNTALTRKIMQDELLACAQSLQERLSKLFGELHILEIDTTNSRVQLRSKAEKNPDLSQGYFELVVDAGGSLTMSKYKYHRSASVRTAMPFPMTIEMAETFINEVAAALKIPGALQKR